MKTYCLTLDLINDPELIREYEKYHQKIWPEIYASIKNSGINSMQIYRFSNRLVMRMEVNDTFSFDHKAALDAANERVQEWEKLMWKYQQALPGARPGEKWMLMTQIFELE